MGIFIDIFVIVAVILLITAVFVQVVVPLFSGEPLFPLFRKSAVKDEIAKAEQALETVAEATHLKKVVNEIERRTAALKDPE